MTLAERFWRKVKKTDGCWLWTAAKDPDGYGYIGIATGRTSQAHRVSWELHIGPIPPGLHVLHSCDTPSCVKPSHLFLGTHTDNMRDMANKGRAATRNHPMAKLTGVQLAEIRSRGGEAHGQLAARYGVSRGQISRILGGTRGKA